MEELRDFNAVIVTRHALPPIYEKNFRILESIPYKKVTITNSAADSYLTHILTAFRDKYEWVINVDDDAFLVDLSALLCVLKTMRDGGFDYCGMADALLYTVRPDFNPCSMNAFFNVFYLPGIWSKVGGAGDGFPLAAYHCDLLERVDMSRLHPEIVNKTVGTISEHSFHPYFEPYYPVFFSLLRNTRPLFLYGRSYCAHDKSGRKVGLVSADDPYTTVLYCPDGKELVYHTWYARNYLEPNPADPSVPPNNRERIDKAFDAAYARFCENSNLLPNRDLPPLTLARTAAGGLE